MDKVFNLAVKEPAPFHDSPDFSTLYIPLRDHSPIKILKKRMQVPQGALLAFHASPNIGEVHAPFAGVIKDITESYIELTTLAANAGEVPSGGPDPISFEGLDAPALAAALKSLGISMRPFTRQCPVFIVNALNPEPGMAYAEEMLERHTHVLEAGLELVRRVNTASQWILALPSGSKAGLPGMTNHYIKPQYPNSLARPLIKLVTGKEYSGNVTMVRLHSLYQLGTVALSGLPLSHTVTTVQGKNYIVPIGAPVFDLLETTGAEPQPGDTVVLGGTMRGTSLVNRKRGIGPTDDALQYIRESVRQPLEDNPCIGCGSCTAICPMRLRPNMLSRYAEFEQYQACRKEYIELCIECGMCAYVCPSRRPMQQHFCMAKVQLGLSTYQITRKK